MLAEHEQPPPGYEVERGVVREVVYVGSVTRYIVDLAAGGVLTSVSQNLEGVPGEAQEQRGRAVQLAWRPEHTYVIEWGEKEEEHG